MKKFLKRNIYTILILLSFNIQAQTILKIYKFHDSLDNSYYPILHFEKYIKHFGISYWSNIDPKENIYLYIMLYYFWKNWWMGYNPLKPSEYNPKIEIGTIIKL